MRRKIRKQGSTRDIPAGHTDGTGRALEGTDRPAEPAPSLPKPERGLCEPIVVPNLLRVDLAVEFIVPPDVDDPFPGDADPIAALDHLDGHVAFLLQRLDPAVRH